MSPSTRPPIIGGNWKMNTTWPESKTLAADLCHVLTDISPVDVIVFPPFTNLKCVADVLRGSPLRIGAQDVFWADAGAFTGEISPPMLLSLDVEYVILGHSERRRILGESSEMVNRKLSAALGSGLRAIVAVGETDEERSRGVTERVLEDQLSGSLAGIDASAFESIVIAYEPVWAIGTGKTATPQQAQETHLFIRNWIRDSFDVAVSQRIRLQYGGSVTAGNARDLLQQPDIDGALVGGASLKPADFAAIVRAQQEVAGS